MALCVSGLLANALAAAPSAQTIYALGAVLQGASGFHRPALEALTQKLARPEEFAAVAALSSVRGTVGMVAGPALAGLLLARWGAVGAYVFDFATFVAAMFFLARIPRERIGRVERPHLSIDERETEVKLGCHRMTGKPVSETKVQLGQDRRCSRDFGIR